MTPEEALSYLNKYQPCMHNSYKKIGIGKWLAKCNYCGTYMELKYLASYQENGKRFREAMNIVTNQINKGAHGKN